MFCKHKFIKDKNNLHCEKCGKYKRMQCDHQWEDMPAQDIINRAGNIQTVLNRTCKVCGEMKQFNLTTGYNN